ncbi:hypothetical protein Dalk_2796 [Desulfatibacillum aliphaticivorans]|uniref:Uncharacterized protein n=2 Tax=Desulfatibacillum aliphaticivorans TaxID=218208 RepID=B8FKW6_DESAL|nr:hypothetical protein Dalk_2796 [Desulfatibacillum aliphaticivorans]
MTLLTLFRDRGTALSEPFIMFMRSREAEQLMGDPAAFTLLAQIAYRAKRTNGVCMTSLEPGQALIGDHKSVGLTQKAYRLAKKRLEKYGLATFQGTNKGTIASLQNGLIFEINADNLPENRGQARGKQGASKEAIQGASNNIDENNINSNCYDQNKTPGGQAEGQSKETQGVSDGATNNNKEERIITSSANSAKADSQVSEFFELLKRYPDHRLIQAVFDAIAVTRKSGKVSDSILLAELRYWDQFSVEKVERSILAYIDGCHHLDGKKENYLRGIMRNDNGAAIKGHGQHHGGSRIVS